MKYNPPAIRILRIQGESLLASSDGSVTKKQETYYFTPSSAETNFDGTLDGDAKDSGPAWDEWED